ncbi:FAD-dependent monooxygenase [Nannocystis sp. SCPEA4]|uniref:FAD-dependent oxidoreductase n=1 Tax=Nannocystis sp. SCPEA4 TaxID=2996787 RepID=UPI00226D4BFE|nr:FAD-dependent monooxygenase [Nannocystis sp. SCPEA4]MCY1054789.1 FAD-dependent monooxygenase [Nannocystis sp. SCPEA4]
MTGDQPVLVVGGGPVGMCLALALVAQGRRVEVFEAEPRLQSDLRGAAYHPPTLELFEAWGILDEVRAAGVEVRELCYWERRTRECVARFDYRLIAGDARFPFRLHCMQHVLCRIAADRLAASPLARVHLGHRFVELQQEADHVVARFATAAGEREVVGAFLCGADGAHSAVRKRLELAFEGVSHEDRFLVLNGSFDIDADLPGLAPVNYVFDPDEWVILLKLPGFRRIVFRARPDEDEAALRSPVGVAARLHGLVGRPMAYSLINLAIYRVHERVAESFHRGRAAILGDAAHINNPAGGMALNAGLQDAADLARTIAAIDEGADPALLSGYTIRRREQSALPILARAGQNLAELRAQEAREREARNQAFRAAAADPALARLHLLRFSMLPAR